MFRLFIQSLCLATFTLAITGCSDTTKYQAAYRGTWVLETRQTPQGDEYHAPGISGRIEWFPTAKDQAHVLMTVSQDANQIQVLDGIYSLGATTFEATAHIRIGGTLGSPVEIGYDTTAEKLTGQITSEDARVIVKHQNGMTFEYIGTQLTITYPNGVIDMWKRQKDEKGALAN